MKTEAQVKAMLDDIMKQDVNLSLLRNSAKRNLEALRNASWQPDTRKMLSYEMMIDGYTSKLKVLDSQANLLLEVLQDE